MLSKVTDKKFLDCSVGNNLDDKYLLRIRDDGIPFNPLEYQETESDIRQL